MQETASMTHPTITDGLSVHFPRSSLLSFNGLRDPKDKRRSEIRQAHGVLGADFSGQHRLTAMCDMHVTRGARLSLDSLQFTGRTGTLRRGRSLSMCMLTILMGDTFHEVRKTFIQSQELKRDLRCSKRASNTVTTQTRPRLATGRPRSVAPRNAPV